MMTFTRLLTLSSALVLAIAVSLPASAQSQRNVGGNNVGTRNIGPGNIGGNPNPGYGCVSVTLATATSVRVCATGYTAQLGNVVCSGGVSQGWRGYTLFQAPCNLPGQNFLGGTLSCQGNFCNWAPSRAGQAQGFRPEYVRAYYN